MSGLRNLRRWYCIPLSVFLIGSFSIVLLLWVNRISERLHDDDVLIDAVMDIQIQTATYHLWLEEAITGNVPIEMRDAVAQVDQGIRLVDAVLRGGETEKRVLHMPLEGPELRTLAKEIRSLLVELKNLGLERHQKTDASGSASELERKFHGVFRESLDKAKALENLLEKDEAENHAMSQRIFLSILTIWTFIVAITTTGLASHERQRRKTEEDLQKANVQLRSQTEELTDHRKRLTELVDSRTAELAVANKQLRMEISEHEQTEVALRASETLLRMLSARLMTAQETERRNIARELHDEVGHALTLMKMRLRSVERLIPDHEEIRGKCNDIMEYIDQTIENVRRLSRDLSPSVLEDLGLTAAIRWLVDTFTDNYDASITLDIEDIDDLLSAENQIMTYRIIQEALTNIGKHAQAENASVTIRKTDGQLSFVIQDNGKGFSPLVSPMKDTAGQGLGLAIMEERVRLLGGSLHRESREGMGTRITFTIPTDRG